MHVRAIRSDGRRKKTGSANNSAAKGSVETGITVWSTRASLLQALQECGEAGLPLRVVRGEVHQHADAPHSLTLLRTPQAVTPPHLQAT
jgi:hypothetical protein